MENILPELIATVVVPLLGAAAVAFHKWLKASISPHQLQTVNQLARVAVDAADELDRASDGIPGNEKYDMASLFVKQAARHVGLKLNEDEVAGFIHAAITGKRNEIEEAVDAALGSIFNHLDLPDTEGDEEAA